MNWNLGTNYDKKKRIVNMRSKQFDIDNSVSNIFFYKKKKKKV